MSEDNLIEKQETEAEPNHDAAPTEADQLKPNDDQLKPEPVKWKIVNQIGRTVRPMAGPASPERMRSEFERMRGVGIPGSIQLLDEKNHIVEQHGTFTEDKPRRYKDEDGKPYEPTMVNMGSQPVDLSSIADKIKAMPETDPDDPEVKIAELQAQLEAKQRYIDGLPGSKPAKKPYEPPRVKPIDPEFASKLRGAVSEARGVKPPTPRSVRMKDAPCKSGLTSIISFFNAAGTKLEEMNHTEDRVRRRRRRFKLELLIRVLFGSPMCSNTVEAAYVDAVDATKM